MTNDQLTITLDEQLVHLKELQKTTEDPKAIKSMQRVMDVLVEIKQHGLTIPQEQDLINIVQDRLQKVAEGKKISSSMNTAYKKITEYAQKELKLTTKKYYTGVYMVLGMPIGLVFGMMIFGTGSMAIGMLLGMTIGIAIGNARDKKAEKEGRQLMTK